MDVSEIVAINNHRSLVDGRDGKGLCDEVLMLLGLAASGLAERRKQNPAL